MLLHGLFGAMSNFSGIIEHFRHTHKVIVPMLPLFELDLLHTTVGGLEKYVSKFIDHRGYTGIHLLGNCTCIKICGKGKVTHFNR